MTCSLSLINNSYYNVTVNDDRHDGRKTIYIENVYNYFVANLNNILLVKNCLIMKKIKLAEELMVNLI